MRNSGNWTNYYPAVFSLYETGFVLLLQGTLYHYAFDSLRPVGYSYMTQYNTNGFMSRVRFIVITNETCFNSQKMQNNFHFYIIVR